MAKSNSSCDGASFQSQIQPQVAHCTVMEDYVGKISADRRITT